MDRNKENSKAAFDRQAAGYDQGTCGQHARSLYPLLLAKLARIPFHTALDLGCDPKQAFFKVILPEISPAILSSFLICLTYSIDDFMISYFNCGTMQTLPIAIYSMTRKKVSPEINALSTIMFLVILSIILVSNALDSRTYRKNQAAIRQGRVQA